MQCKQMLWGGVLVVLWSAAHAASDGVVRLAVVGDFTGSYADVGGQGALIAGELAVEERGGEAAGAPVELLAIDSHGSAETAADALASAHREMALDAVITVDSAATAVRAHRFALDQGLVFIHSGAATRGLTSEYCAPTAFQWVPPMYSYAVGVRDGLADKGVDSWYFLASQEGGEARLRNVLREVFSIATSRIIGIGLFPAGAQDLEPQVTAAIDSGADVIALAEPGGSSIAALRTAYERGRTPRQSELAAMQLTLSDVRQIGLYVAGGLRMVTPFLWNADDETEAWSRRFRHRAGTMPTAVQASTYSAVRHYLMSVSNAGDDDAESVAAEMHARAVDDVYAGGGRVWGDGQLVMDMYFVQVNDPSQSREAWDYFRVIDRFPAPRVFPIERVEGC